MPIIVKIQKICNLICQNNEHICDKCHLAGRTVSVGQVWTCMNSGWCHVAPRELPKHSDSLANRSVCRSDISRVQLKSNWTVGETLLASVQEVVRECFRTCFSNMTSSRASFKGNSFEMNQFPYQPLKRINSAFDKISLLSQTVLEPEAKSLLPTVQLDFS